MTNVAKIFDRFLKDEDGMVTVEWVALSAAVTIGGIAIGWAVLDSLSAPAASIGTTIDSVDAALPTQPASLK